MAYELQIRNTQERVKIRSPWAVALLPIITLGIYHLVWWYRINREMRDYGRAKGYDLGQNPTASLLALFPGGIIIVPALISYWRGTKRVQGAARIAGQEPPSGWIALILYLLIALGFYAYLQVSLNDVCGPRRNRCADRRRSRRYQTPCLRGFQSRSSHRLSSRSRIPELVYPTSGSRPGESTASTIAAERRGPRTLRHEPRQCRLGTKHSAVPESR